MALHCGPHASELNWYKVELQAPLGPPYCYHRFLSYQGQRIVMRQTARHQWATPMGHSCPIKTKWTSPRDSTWTFPPRESGPLLGRACQHGSRVTTVAGRSSHCPRHCLPQKYASSQSEHACHSFPSRKSLFQEKNVCHADKNMFFSY